MINEGSVSLAVNVGGSYRWMPTPIGVTSSRLEGEGAGSGAISEAYSLEAYLVGAEYLHAMVLVRTDPISQHRKFC